MFLWELWFQCELARHAQARLRQRAKREIERRQEELEFETVTEVLANCSVFLSAASVIARILFPNPIGSKIAKKIANTRGQKLRVLLEVHDLPTLRSVSVRNAFEHIDERLDRFLRDNPSTKLIQYHLTRKPPGDGIVLKRFDPNTLSISYLGESLDIAACYREIKLVQENLAFAHKRIRTAGGLLGEH